MSATFASHPPRKHATTRYIRCIRCIENTACRVALLAIGALALDPHPGASQTDRLVGETVDVRVVNVDAVVIDKKGRPVRGLGPDDFRVFEDGRPVEITNFATYEMPAGKSPRRESRTASASSVPPVSETVDPAPLTVAIYLDDRGTELSHRRRVLEDIISFIEGQPAGAASWILGSFKNRFEVLVGPTSDPGALLHVLADLKPDPRSQEWQLAERRTLDGIQASYQACESTFCTPCVDNWAEMLAIARGHAASEEQRATWATNGLADVIGTLSGLAGRKIVIYVGTGFEQRSGMATFSYLADLCGQRDSVQSEIFQTILEYDQTNRLQELTAYANSNRVTFYMLDAAGVHPTRRASVDFADSKFVPTSVNDQVRRDNFQNMHFALADETGGTAILNANRPLQALEGLTVEWADATYSLGFSPPHAPTGQSHRIRVELVGGAAKGNRVRYRRSYLDKKLEAELVDRLTSTLFLERDQNPLGIEVAAGEPERLGRNRYQVPVEIRLPRDAFLRLEGSPDPRGQARLWMAAVSDRGGRSTVRQTLEDIDPPGADGEGGGGDGGPASTYTVVVRIDLERGTHRLAIGVRDEIAQIESLISLPIEVVDTDR